MECAAIWTEPAIKLSDGRGRYGEITYPLPLLGDVQLTNSAIAIATLQILQAQGWQISSSAIATGMGKTRWPGRIQWVQWHDYTLLIDGAHNPDSARMLRNYVDTINKPITWVIGMLSTKDHQEIFRELLRPSDYLYLLPVPDHSSALPAELALLAKAICPQLDKLETHEDLAMALSQAVANSERVTVLCGSLYLLGYFLSKVQSDQVQLPC